MDYNLKKLANFFKFSLWIDRAFGLESTLDRSFRKTFLADFLLVFNYYPQVKAIGNRICKVLTRKQPKYCDMTPLNKKTGNFCVLIEFSSPTGKPTWSAWLHVKTKNSYLQIILMEYSSKVWTLLFFRVLPELLDCWRRRGIFTTVNLHCSCFVQTLRQIWIKIIEEKYSLALISQVSCCLCATWFEYNWGQSN